MEGLIMTAQLLLGLSILVGLHELGHLIAAKVFGMRVEKYSIGFPPFQHSPLLSTDMLSREDRIGCIRHISWQAVRLMAMQVSNKLLVTKWKRSGPHCSSVESPRKIPWLSSTPARLRPPFSLVQMKFHHGCAKETPPPTYIHTFHMSHHVAI